MGLDFFRRAAEIERKYLLPGVQVERTLQTNGTLLDAEWCEFLRANNYLVGLSLDGPPDLHDTYRRDKAGQADLRSRRPGRPPAPGAWRGVQPPVYGEREERFPPAAGLPLLPR